ncbi:SusC/RagA family TonB-linked outer membrane protein [Dyadobacter bucti]|uniref:SusC/RagA family TonB-linked outer membrane protein n=1 Tax=Dyadobacter bucti TaxID=2572203 RepID=UPI001109591B|nr:SusC/RagA family TonB-linked outer membrane protein [Dyadobacter bucti]
MKKLILMSALLLFAVWSGAEAGQQKMRVVEKKSGGLPVSQRKKLLGSVLKDIREMRGIYFLYDTESVKDHQVSDFKIEAGQDVEVILRKLLRGTDLTFEKIDTKTYIIRSKSPQGRAAPVKPDKTAEVAVAAAISGRNVSGTVKDDEDGKGLPGVSIVVKGTMLGTTTDANGNFQLMLEEGAAILAFSYIGYDSREIEVASVQTTLDISLRASVRSLSEVVVVGYGTQKVSDITGSVARVNEKTLQSRPVSNFQEALQGRTSGVQIRQTGGDLAGKFSVNIRGIGSVTGSNNPLIVVDGVPLFSGDFSSINPKDIVSIDVLKDASATAIYGSRASNGVLIITTRRGKSGKTEFTFSTSLGIEEIAKRYDVLSTEQQRLLFIEAFKNTNRNTSVYEDLGNPAWGVNTDWQKLVTQTGFRQEYNMSMSGGTEKSRFAISASYLKRKGIIRTSDLSSFFFRANNDITFSPKFKVSSSLSGSHQEQSPVSNDSFHGGAYKSAISVHSYVQPFDQNGNLAGISSTADPYFGENRNPLIDLYLPTRKAATNRLLGNLKSDWELAEGLTLSGNVGADLVLLNNYTFLPVYKIGIYSLDQGSVTEGSEQQINWVTDATLQYAKLFGKHDFKILAGTSAQAFYAKRNSVTGTGTVDNTLNQLSNQTNFSATGSDVTAGLASVFGRINYGFDSRYLLTATVRRDGSSKFGSNKRYGIFPSASVAWRLSEEAFMKGQNVINDLKLRTGYGLTGNQNIGDYAFITRAGAAPYVFGNGVVVGNAPQNIGNPNLQWESAKQFDAGVDLSFSNNRIQLTLDYYIKKSENLLINTPLPFTAGVPENPTVNIGSVQNRGFELDVSSRNLTGKLGWTTGFNLTFNENKVLDIGTNSIGDPLEIPGATLELPGEPANVTRAGQPVASYYMYRFDGIWQTADKDEAAKFGAVPGDPRYADLNGNGKFDVGDKEIAGIPNPKLFGGLSNNLTYGPLSLSVFFQYSMGNKLYNSMRNLNARSVPFNQQLAEIADFWTPENPSNTIPRPSQGGNTTYLATRVSTRFLENADYLRLKDVSLSYEFPASMIRNLKIYRARLSLQATNLLTFTKYQGLDPESSSRSELMSAGIDNTPYPLTRMYSASIQIGF